MGARYTLVLASASPARRRVLRCAGIEPEVIVSGVDESSVEYADAEQLCATLARLKAEAVVLAVAASTAAGNTASVRPVAVLGCDSVLEFAGEVFGKPADEAEAIRRWRRLRGHSGVLRTGHCVIDVLTGRVAESVAGTTVHFADISDAEIATYVATGEPLRVAGAFTIDGLGGWFIERIDGDPGNVIGVSLPVLRRLLAEIGVGVDDLWSASLTSVA